ncbi:MAG: cobaltochelatase [Rhodobacter sp. CACIA14H1]|nr:MAG: cobaltochelatase [Rhodobacter sp. CACIA14H1]
MDYGKNGNPKIAKDSHHPLDQPRRGAPKGDDKAAKKKAELLARMKAAADARKPKP